MQPVRIIDFPACRMVSSGTGMFGSDAFDRFEAWLTSLPRPVWPADYLTWNGEGFLWLRILDAGMSVPDGFSVVDFPGGLYAVATDVDQQTDQAALTAEVSAFLRASGLAMDHTRPELGNVITTPAVRSILQYEQMDYYFPVCPL